VSDYKQIAPRLTRAAVLRDPAIVHAQLGSPRQPVPVRTRQAERVTEGRPYGMWSAAVVTTKGFSSVPAAPTPSR